MLAEKIWVDQCDATRNLKIHFGAEQAMGYLIGEKLLAYLEAAETDETFRSEVPLFVAEIKKIFEFAELSDFFTTPRRLGPMGHAMSKQEFKSFQDANHGDEAETGRRHAFEQARKLLLGDG